MNDISEKVKAKIDAGREYRAMEMRVCDPKKKGEDREAVEERIVEGYATTFDEPYLLYRFDDWEVWEKVDAQAFAETDMSDVIMQYDHEGRVFARLSNGTLELDADDHGLHVRADLGGTEIGRQLYDEIKGGYTSKMSFGFTVRADEYDQHEDEDGHVTVTRTIKDIGKLYDVSAVSYPANSATEISSRAFSEGVIAEAKAERLRLEEETRKRKALIAQILIEAER